MAGSCPAHLPAPQALLCRAALCDLFSQSGTAPTQVQPIAPGLAEPHGVPMGPLPKCVQVPWMASLTSTESPALLSSVSLINLDLIVCMLDKDIEEYQSQKRALRDTSCHWPPPGHWAMYHNSLSVSIQPSHTHHIPNTHHIVRISNPCLSSLDRRMSCSSSSMKNIYVFIVRPYDFTGK